MLFFEMLVDLCKLVQACALHDLSTAIGSLRNVLINVEDKQAKTMIGGQAKGSGSEIASSMQRYKVGNS